MKESSCRICSDRNSILVSSDKIAMSMMQKAAASPLEFNLGVMPYVLVIVRLGQFAESEPVVEARACPINHCGQGTVATVDVGRLRTFEKY